MSSPETPVKNKAEIYYDAVTAYINENAGTTLSDACVAVAGVMGVKHTSVQQGYFRHQRVLNGGPRRRPHRSEAFNELLGTIEGIGTAMKAVRDAADRLAKAMESEAAALTAREEKLLDRESELAEVQKMLGNLSKGGARKPAG